ncbi:hypothetical protein GGS20DRAFT_237790 [Poronia punctata]|nr:hypothetical protein GGS20DRAFT_237790 [Poronia punctata]
MMMQKGDVLMGYSPMSDATSVTVSSPSRSPVGRQCHDGVQSGSHDDNTTMLDSPYNNHEVQSSRACEKCRASKRKCDKKLPSCDRCLRLNAKCYYAQDTGLNSSYSQSARVIFLQQSHSLASDALFRSVDPLEGISASQILSLLSQDARPGGLENDYHHSAAHYFRFIHPWYAVVHPTLFYRHLEGIGATDSCSPTDLASPPLSFCAGDFQDTDPKRQPRHTLAPKELALLVVLMNLSIRMRLTDAGEQDMFDSTYRTCKRLLAMLLMTCADGPHPSIEAVQCGALMALYEYGHGEIHTAYQTLSQTVGAARTLGICSAQRSEDEANATPLTLQEEQRSCLWWGLFILEQFILQDDSMRHLPFILESPSETTLLPESPPIPPAYSTTSRGATNLPTPPPRLPAAGVLTTAVDVRARPLGYFQLSAKTASMFHRALLIDKERWKRVGDNPLSPTNNPALKELDKEIRDATAFLLAQSLDWETKLDCFAMLISALFVLYTPFLPVLERSAQAVLRTEEDLSIALAALQFACKMSRDISCKINANFNPGGPYPTVLCAPAGATCYRVILAYSSFARMFPNDHTECQRAIAEKFESLWLFSFRWGLAEKMMSQLKYRAGLDREYYLRNTAIMPPGRAASRYGQAEGRN